MARACRDCRRCTELGIVSLALMPFRLAWWLGTSWNIGLLVRKCPVCRHRMDRHIKVGGRFQD